MPATNPANAALVRIALNLTKDGDAMRLMPMAVLVALCCVPVLAQAAKPMQSPPCSRLCPQGAMFNPATSLCEGNGRHRPSPPMLLGTCPAAGGKALKANQTLYYSDLPQAAKQKHRKQGKNRRQFY